MKNSRILFGIFGLVLAVFLISSVSAITTPYGEWQDNSSSLTITNGQNAGFNFYFESTTVPFTASIKLYDSSNNLVHNFLEQSISQNYYYNDNVVNITPAIYLTNGSYILIFSATDRQRNSTMSIDLTVNSPANNAPVITSTPITSVNESASYSYQVVATDADNDTLTYSFTQSPSWLSINSSTGLISGIAPGILTDTPYQVTVQVSDGTSAVTQTYILTEINIPSVTPDTTNPTVALNSPADNSITNSTSVTFSAAVSDNVAIANVSLYINGVLNQTNSSGLNNTNYNFPVTLSNGSYTWYIQAYDTSGNFASSPVSNLTVNTSASDTTPPQIQFVYPTPADNSALSQNSIPVNVTASDASGIQSIVVKLYNSNNVLIDTRSATSSSFSFSFTNLASGTYYIRATATDNAGNINTTGLRKITLTSSSSSSSSGSGSSSGNVVSSATPAASASGSGITSAPISLGGQVSSNSVWTSLVVLMSILILGAGAAIVVLIRKR